MVQETSTKRVAQKRTIPCYICGLHTDPYKLHSVDASMRKYAVEGNGYKVCKSMRMCMVRWLANADALHLFDVRAAMLKASGGVGGDGDGNGTNQ